MEILRPATVGIHAAEHRGSSDTDVAKLRAQVARLQAEREALRYAAGHDELTGLPNRRLFYTLATPVVGLAGVSAAVLVIDLDGFKPINDNHGHAVGDQVLRIIAYRLASWAGDNLVARLGGDEFAILLTHAGPQDCQSWWRPAVLTLAAMVARPIPLGEHRLAVTASIGIAPLHGPTPVRELLHRADTAMYKAKQHARRTGRADRAWACGPAGHEDIPLGREPASRQHRAIAAGHSGAASRPVVLEFAILSVAAPAPADVDAPPGDPRDRDPACVAPAGSYRGGDKVWVHRHGAWRPGVVQGASETAVLARYRCGEGPGTGVDSMSAEYVAPRATSTA